MRKEALARQQDERLIAFVVQITTPPSPETGGAVLITCLAHDLGKLRYSWRIPNKALFVDIYRSNLTRFPVGAKFQARDSAAKMFWEVNLMNHYWERGLPFSSTARDVIATQAEQIVRSFPRNFGLPDGFLIDLELLSPDNTRSCDWWGTRERIMNHRPADGQNGPKTKE